MYGKKLSSDITSPKPIKKHIIKHCYSTTCIEKALTHCNIATLKHVWKNTIIKHHNSKTNKEKIIKIAILQHV